MTRKKHNPNRTRSRGPHHLQLLLRIDVSSQLFVFDDDTCRYTRSYLLCQLHQYLYFISDILLYYNRRHAIGRYLWVEGGNKILLLMLVMMRRRGRRMGSRYRTKGNYLIEYLDTSYQNVLNCYRHCIHAAPTIDIIALIIAVPPPPSIHPHHNMKCIPMRPQSTILPVSTLMMLLIIIVLFYFSIQVACGIFLAISRRHISVSVPLFVLSLVGLWLQIITMPAAEEFTLFEVFNTRQQTNGNDHSIIPITLEISQ